MVADGALVEQKRGAFCGVRLDKKKVASAGGGEGGGSRRGRKRQHPPPLATGGDAARSTPHGGGHRAWRLCPAGWVAAKAARGRHPPRVGYTQRR